MRPSKGYSRVVGKSLLLLPEAVRDIADTYNWYEERRTGLGGEFIQEVEASFESMLRHPEMYAIVHESYRRALIRRFPYVVFYEHSGDIVTVYAVLHSSRDPMAWRMRLP
jgi:plasmid stabilization system protein ParE